MQHTFLAIDGLNASVRWEGRDLAQLAGQTVRLQVRLQRTSELPPRIFALYLDEEN